MQQLIASINDGDGAAALVSPDAANLQAGRRQRLLARARCMEVDRIAARRLLKQSYRLPPDIAHSN
jgi:hypothetical protein